MSIEIMKSIVSLIQQGGWFAIGGVCLWGVFKVIQLCLVVYLFKVLATLAYKLSNNYLSVKHLLNREKVAILSSTISDQLCSALDTFQKSMTESVERLEKQFQASKKSSEEK